MSPRIIETDRKDVMTNAATNTVDDAEIAKFEAMAAEWWDLEGKFKPLHLSLIHI